MKSNVVELPAPSAPVVLEAGTHLPTDLQLTPGDMDKLSRGQPWDEATVVREILLNTEMMIHSHLEIGRLLLWSRATIERGSFDGWIKANFPFKRRSVYNFMQVAYHSLRHPSLAEPMARIGICKALEIARLPDSIVEDLVNGQLPELEVHELETLTWPELKKRLAKVEAERADLVQVVEDQKTKIKTLQDEEAEEAAANGRLTKGAQRKVIEKFDKLRDEFDKLMAEIGFTCDAAANRCASGELDIAVRLRVKGFTQYILAYAEVEESRFRCLANEDVTGAEIAEPWHQPRTMDDVYTLPAGRALPFQDET